MRLIARLDIKSENLIKTIQMEGLRVVGSPNDYAFKYYLQGIDEIIYIDTVASLYGRNHLDKVIKEATKNIFIPITVGGGIRSVDDARSLLNSGADKIAINTAAIKNPSLISELSKKFGEQCIVLFVAARKNSDNSWEALVENGREKTGIDVLDWICEAQNRGIGEILLTSVDMEGTLRGFDIELIQAVTGIAKVPIIANGGMGAPNDAVKAVNIGGADAISMAGMLHYEKYSIHEVREACNKNNIEVRELAPED